MKEKNIKSGNKISKTKKNYQSPQLTEYGSVRKLTLPLTSLPMGDGMGTKRA